MKLDQQLRECMGAYIEQLKVEYDNLSTDPFSNKARIAIRQEIEAIKCMMEEARMTDAWNQIASALNIEEERPDRHKEELDRLNRKEESAVTAFKGRMNQDSLLD